MRKLLSAGVLATATVAALLPVFTAQANPLEEGYSSEAEWTYVEDYFHLVDCRDEGELGQDAGEWDRYRCEFQVIPGEWHLFVTSDDDHGDQGEPGDDEEGQEDD